VFEECSFVEASFRQSKFIDCLFRDCDLSMIDVRDCLFRRTRLERSKAIGINWTEGSWQTAKPLFSAIDFHDCSVSYATFIGLQLSRMSMIRCVTRDSDFSNADMTLADLRGTDFAGSRFYHTNLTEADYSGATNYTINAALNTLKGTKFSFPEAISLLRALDIILTG